MSNAIRILEALGASPAHMCATGLAADASSGLDAAQRAALLSGDGPGLAVLLGAPEHVMMQLWTPQETRRHPRSGIVRTTTTSATRGRVARKLTRTHGVAGNNAQAVADGLPVGEPPAGGGRGGRGKCRPDGDVRRPPRTGDTLRSADPATFRELLAELTPPRPTTSRPGKASALTT